MLRKLKKSVSSQLHSLSHLLLCGCIVVVISARLPMFVGNCADVYYLLTTMDMFSSDVNTPEVIYKLHDSIGPGHFHIF